MKKTQIDQTVSRQVKTSSHKKYSLFGIFVLCLLLGFGIIVSAVVLASGISRFSRRDVNVIPLVPMQEAHSESESDSAAALSYNESDQKKSDSLLASPEKNSSGITAGRTKYTSSQSKAAQGELQVYDDVRTWSSETHVDLFKSDYGGTVKSSKGEKIIAPGTSNLYNFTLKNNGNIPLDYDISLEVGTYLGEEKTYSDIPLEWRLLAGDGKVISDWREYNDRTEVLRQATLEVRHQDNYTIEWRWAFGRGGNMDEEDTDMGNLAVDQPLGVNAAIYVRTEQSAGWDGSTGQAGRADRDSEPSAIRERVTPKTGDASGIVLYAVILAVSACVLLILSAAYRYRKKVEDVQDDQK